MANEDEELVVVVRRQWNDWLAASYRLKDFSGAHWSHSSGGVSRRAPREFIHGYVSCEER
jgi:hypothetical protein